jgi:hypothetical protein
MPEQSVKLCECGCGEPTPIATKTRTRWGTVKGQGVRFIHGHSQRLQRHDPPWLPEDRGYKTPCHIWRGAKSLGGYGGGRVINGRRVEAHRLAWIDTHGPIPDGMCVLHHCDVPPCVNPDHLFLGTHADNAADKVAKGRHGWPTKLSPADVEAIRAARGTPQQELAERFGVARSTISRIQTGTQWKSL